MNELDITFAEITQIIGEARDNAYRKVNEELILMYQRVGRFLSEKSKEANYGDGYIDSLADYIQKQFPGIKVSTAADSIECVNFMRLMSGAKKCLHW